MIESIAALDGDKRPSNWPPFWKQVTIEVETCINCHEHSGRNNKSACTNHPVTEPDPTNPGKERPIVIDPATKDKPAVYGSKYDKKWREILKGLQQKPKDWEIKDQDGNVKQAGTW